MVNLACHAPAGYPLRVHERSCGNHSNGLADAMLIYVVSDLGDRMFEIVPTNPVSDIELLAHHGSARRAGPRGQPARVGPVEAGRGTVAHCHVEVARRYTVGDRAAEDGHQPG